jgi:phosphoribosylformimino-5-aminoimidazole carboxamide ribotide isomerase
VILLPAIDIRDGRAVRLLKGEYDRETAYHDDPVVAAKRWADAGASWLHVVDLDGARAGEPVNLEHVRRIVAGVAIPVQLGGGLRDSKKVEEAFSAGAERVVLGTAAVRDPDLAEAIASAHGDRVVAAVDARAGQVAAEGWTEPSGIGPADLAAKLAERGVRHQDLDGFRCARPIPFRLGQSWKKFMDRPSLWDHRQSVALLVACLGFAPVSSLAQSAQPFF